MLWLIKHPKFSAFLASLLILTGFFYYFLVQPAWFLYQESKVLPRLIRPARNAVLRQDVSTLAFELRYLQPHIAAIKYSTERLSVFSFLPVVGNYLADFKNLTDAFLPVYDGTIDLTISNQDLFSTIKFGGWGKVESSTSADEATSTNQDLNALTTQLLKFKEKLTPFFDSILKINETKYPVELRERRIRENIKKVKEIAQVGRESFDDLVALLNLSPEILGMEKAQNYLLLIQNEKGIRPGGGLISGYVILSLEKGELKLLKSGDAAFLGVNFKDANSSPDFKTSAQNISSAYSKTANPLPLQGVITIDGKFLSALTRILGEIRLEDGTAINGENVEQFLSQFFQSTGRRDPESQKSKSQTSIFLNELLKKAISTLPQTYGQVLPAIIELSKEKHLMIYFKDERFQALAEKYNLAGRIQKL